jgi:tRNA (pseudouridine54-N1)-methyltransferase
MREFILRARKGPSTPDFSLDELSRAGRLEVVAHCIANALFYAKHIRPHTVIHIVLDGPSDPPKTVRFETETLGILGGFDERTLGGALQEALRAGQGLFPGEETEADSGIFVAKRGFEALVKQKREDSTLFYLERRGTDIRSVSFPRRTTFVFTDHLSMPKKSGKFLQRLGAQPISVGPKTLFASQCIVLAHNELDRQGIP